MEVIEYLKKWEIHYIHRLENLRLLGCKFSPYLSIDSMQSNPNSFIEIKKLIPKFIQQCKGSQIGKPFLKERAKLEDSLFVSGPTVKQKESRLLCNSDIKIDLWVNEDRNY